MTATDAITDAIYDAVLHGRRTKIDGLLKEALDAGIPPADIIQEDLRPAMDEVGTRFSTGEYFLPDLILSAEAMKSAIGYLRPLLTEGDVTARQEKIVVGTVQGDVHDIGKNLVIATLEGSGYQVIDLGVDVPASRFVEAVQEHDPAAVGLSALLSTTMVNVPKTIKALDNAGLRQGRIIAVGGAPVTQRSADIWGADIYAPDAGTAAKLVTERLAHKADAMPAPTPMAMPEIIVKEHSAALLEPARGEPDVARFIAALRGQPVDRVPNFENLVDDQHVTKLLGRYAGNTLAIGGDPAKGASEATGRPMHAKDFVEFAQLTGQDVLVMEALWTPFKKRLPDGSLVPAMNRSVKTRADWESLVMPGDDDIEERLRYVREYKAATKGTRIGTVLLCAAIFQTLYEFVVGLADAMKMCYEERDLMEEILDVSADYYARMIEKAIDEGLDVVYMADDFAWKEGLFIPPALFKEIWLPRAQRTLAPAFRAGVPVIYHSDGKVDDALDWLIDMGIIGLNPMDPYGIDYRDYKKRYGNRIGLMGNIDVEYPLVHGTPAEVEKDVREHMEVLKPGYRYVAGSSHSITNFIPHENYITMMNAIHRYGAY
jgi:5-methyltetrahydrofolate--homocysteine methyltransferase